MRIDGTSLKTEKGAGEILARRETPGAMERKQEVPDGREVIPPDRKQIN